MASLPGVRLISLQKGEGTAQLADLPAGMAVEIPGQGFDEGDDAFIDSAAVMQSVDLVIAPDTALTHLAGALGRPAWALLRYSPHWPWLLQRDDSVWYPGMQLFRQPQAGDWQSVVDHLVLTLRDVMRISRDVG